MNLENITRETRIGELFGDLEEMAKSLEEALVSLEKIKVLKSIGHAHNQTMLDEISWRTRKVFSISDALKRIPFTEDKS